MEGVEVRTARIVQRVRIQDAIIATVYVATAFTLLLAAPNTLQLLKRIDPARASKRHPSRRMSQAVSRLVSRGLLVREHGSIQLTQLGRRYAERLEKRKTLTIKIPRHWDGRWRIVIFDIWERRRDARNRLRAMLIKVGFKKVQNSVWAYPYDCEELIAFLRTELRLGRGVLYLIAEGVEGDKSLRKSFNLS